MPLVKGWLFRFRLPFQGFSTRFALADCTDYLGSGAAVLAFYDMWSGLIGLVFGWVVMREGRFVLLAIAAVRIGLLEHSERARGLSYDIFE